MAENIDQKLIQQYLTGDDESLESLIQKYLRPIYRLVYGYVKNASEADDLTQEIFIRMWRNLKKFDQRRSFKPWLFTIAKNACLDFLRKKKTIPFSQFEDQGGENILLNVLPDPAIPVNDILDQKNLHGQINRSMEQLAKKYRDIIILHHDDGLSFREIAETLDESINTVKSQYRRALMVIRKMIIPVV